MKRTTFVGLDVHKRWINVAVLLPGQDTPVEWRIANEPQAIRKMLKKVADLSPGDVRYCYEAGPCGYALQRQIISWCDASCMLVAPSLIPRKPGERIKTDRRDAKKLAHLFRARHRVSKLLLRRAITFSGKRTWNLAHRRWLESLRFESTVDSVVLNDYILAIDQIEQRLKDLLVHIERLAVDPRYAAAVAKLRCFRSIDTITAVGLAVELHNFQRFTSARRLMSFVGLIPGEHSSGDKRRQGAITKTGNSHVRRLLIEAAWNYRHRPRVGPTLRNRRKQSPKTIALADRAMHRLYRRYQQMSLRGVQPQKAIVAMAQELAGFVWAALAPLTTESATN